MSDIFIFKYLHYYPASPFDPYVKFPSESVPFALFHSVSIELPTFDTPLRSFSNAPLSLTCFITLFPK